MDPVLIIGTGLAGYTAARELRKLDPDIPITLVSADDGCFYSKPNLSNAFRQGKDATTLANASATQMAEQHRLRIRRHTTVAGLDLDGRKVRTDDGDSLGWSRLVLAVGANPVRLPVGGDAAERVLSVNDLQDYATLRARLEGRREVTILGAGLIGCEFANDLAAAGFEVTVIEPAGWPLSRLVPEPVGRDLERALAAAGVRWKLGRVAERVGQDRDDGVGYRLWLGDGSQLEADVVLSAVGLKPRVRIAEEAGLKIGRGIVVDRHLATSARDVYALGDCMEVDGLVLPFVMPIMHAGRALARTLSGTPTPVTYPAMPILVKTFSHPVVVAPPLPWAEGEWECEAVDGGVRALFRDPGGTVLGFALSGAATAERQALARGLPAWLD